LKSSLEKLIDLIIKTMSQKNKTTKTTPKPSPRNTLLNYFSKSASKTPQNAEKSEHIEKMEIDDVKSKVLTGKKLDFGEEKLSLF
jgi:hypothetical protein